MCENRFRSLPQTTSPNGATDQVPARTLLPTSITSLPTCRPPPSSLPLPFLRTYLFMAPLHHHHPPLLPLHEGGCQGTACGSGTDQYVLGFGSSGCGGRGGRRFDHHDGQATRFSAWLSLRSWCKRLWCCRNGEWTLTLYALGC